MNVLFYGTTEKIASLTVSCHVIVEITLYLPQKVKFCGASDDCRTFRLFVDIAEMYKYLIMTIIYFRIISHSNMNNYIVRVRNNREETLDEIVDNISLF